MPNRKLILTVLLLSGSAFSLTAQVNSRNPENSPNFQTGLDDRVNAESSQADSSSSAAPSPAPAPAPQEPPVAKAIAVPARADGPPVAEIIKNAIRRDEELRELREEFTYQLKVVTERLDDDNKVEPDKSKTVTAKIKPGKDITFSADFNDDPKSKDSDSGNKTTSAGASGGRGLNAKSRSSDDDDDSSNKDVEDAKKVNAMLDMAKIAPRFNYSRLDDDTVRARRCFVIKFSPKPDQPFASREEKVINKVGGNLWIDQQDFSIVRTKGKLTEEVDVAWFLATMKSMSFDYQTDELEAISIPVPSLFSMNFDLNIMGYRFCQRQNSTMNDYQKFVAASSTSPQPASPSPANP